MITINELFSGIGAQVAALKRNGVKFKVVGISEIDKYAIKSYEAINGKTRNYGDISKAEALDYADLWTYSFPCTDISLAGKQAGLTDETGKQTRSGLLFEVERLLKKSVEDGNQPKYLLLENVKNLVGKKFKPEFDKWLSTLEDLGYNNYWKVLNAKDYGVPQNRERVFVVSIRKDVDTHGYTFPEPFKLNRRLKDVLETNVDEKYYLKQELVETFIKRLAKREVSNTIRCGGAGSIEQKHSLDLVVASTQKNAYKGSTDGSSPCLTAAMGMGGGQIPMIVNCGNKNFSQHTQDLVAEQVTSLTDYKTPKCYSGIIQLGNIVETDSFGGNPERGRIYDDKGISPCLSTMQGGGLEPKIFKNCRIRKLTPKECWRLMDFTDEEFEAAQNAGVSKTQLYKQAGNSIVVSVLAGIFNNLLGEQK